MLAKKIQSGDTAVVQGELRMVTTLIKNADGNIVIAWSSDHVNKQAGVCTQSLWDEWASGVNLKERR